MSESRSLLQDVDSTSTSLDSPLQTTEDCERAQPFLHVEDWRLLRRRWVNRGRLFWFTISAFGLVILVYLLSWLSQDHELLSKISKLDALGT